MNANAGMRPQPKVEQTTGPRIYAFETSTFDAATLRGVAALGFDWVCMPADTGPDKIASVAAAGLSGMIRLDQAAHPAGRDNSLSERDAQIALLQKAGAHGFLCAASTTDTVSDWENWTARARLRGSCVFVLDALACHIDQARSLAGAGFDFRVNSFAWWDGRAEWALQQYEAFRTLLPSIAFPLARESFAADDSPALFSARALCDYARAAVVSSGLMMSDAFHDSVASDGAVDFEMSVAALNSLRARLPSLNREGTQWSVASPDAQFAALLRIDAGHAAAGTHATLVVLNHTAHDVEVDASALLMRAGGQYGPFAECTPDGETGVLQPGMLTLAPHAFRIFAARLMPPLASASAPPDGAGRVIVENVRPTIDAFGAATKRLVGEIVKISADIFTDGHEHLAAEIQVRGVAGDPIKRVPMALISNDRWATSLPLERNGAYEVMIEAWRDRFASWLDEVTKKRAAAQDVSSETIEGARLVAAIAKAAADGVDGRALAALAKIVNRPASGSPAQLDAIIASDAVALLGRNAIRDHLTRAGPVTLYADRLAAQFSAWYELFPRSQSNDADRHGTFDDVVARLPYVRDMGFDVLYFPPIHPIGVKNRKGRNNAVRAQKGDVGSVYAVGAAEGGHDAIHPQLGTFEDFARLVSAAHDYGLEIALDFAVQCSPDHPWIKQHPEWFDWRPDGTLKFAENPPKKYEDIVNVEFYGAALPSLWEALRDVVLFWAAHGVRIFRVDNPHTKPIPFWKWMIAEVNARYPDVLFLAEAFTRPKMMRKLAKIGFQQSYTYFTWRNTKAELVEYMEELRGEMGEYYRPNFFANTPDINPPFLQQSGPAGFMIRATLAAMLSSVYGLYSGFEFGEAAPIPGKEEYLDSEKYELRPRSYDLSGDIAQHIRALNRIRRANPALWDFRNVQMSNAWNDNILAFYKCTPNRDNCILVLINLDPRSRQDCIYEVPLWEFGLSDQASIQVEDLIGGNRFTLHGKTHTIALDPADRSAVIWRLIPPVVVA